MEYDPVSSWNCLNADSASEQVKRSRPLDKKQIRKGHKKPNLSSFEPGLPKGAGNFPAVAEQLRVQKDREMNLSHDNLHFVKPMKYSLKPEFNNWKLHETFEAETIRGGREIIGILREC